MPQFTWTSRDPYDVVRSGIITAPTAHRAAAALAARAIKADAVLPLPESASADGARSPELDLGSIRSADLLLSLRDMVGLLRHGVDRRRVFTALGAATHHPVLAEVLQTMGQRTQSGTPLYQAMASWPALFDRVVQHLVRHGEGENRLAECIKAVHAYLEFSQAMTQLGTHLQGKPAAIVGPARDHIVRGRALACLAAGQLAGLPLDANWELAARHCGDKALAERMLAAGQGLPSDARASGAMESLSRALVTSGCVEREAWTQAVASTPAGQTHAALQMLAQQRSSLAAQAVDRLDQRLQWGLKAGLRIAAVGLAVVLWLVFTSR